MKPVAWYFDFVLFITTMPSKTIDNGYIYIYPMYKSAFDRGSYVVGSWT